MSSDKITFLTNWLALPECSITSFSLVGERWLLGCCFTNLTKGTPRRITLRCIWPRLRATSRKRESRLRFWSRTTRVYAKHLVYYLIIMPEVHDCSLYCSQDVTEIIGTGKVDLGFKAMIHTLAAKARDFPVLSIGSLLDEPFTGVVYLKDSGITTDFRTLKGKRIGYVGEFGKVRLHHRHATLQHHQLTASIRSKSTSSPPTTA